jgi:hypothetical protein
MKKRLILFSIIFVFLWVTGYSKGYLNISAGAGVHVPYGTMPEYVGYGSPESGTGIGWEAGMGYAYFLEEKIAFQFSVRYSSKKLKIVYPASGDGNEASQEHEVKNLKISAGILRYFDENGFLAGGVVLYIPTGDWKFEGTESLGSGTVDEEFQKASIGVYLETGWNISFQGKPGFHLASLDIGPKVEAGITPHLENGNYKLYDFSVGLLVRLNFGY